MTEETTPRPRILYADSGPTAPYPLQMEGAVISGFGRGSKELGIPTANLPVDASVTPWIEDARSGVYFGWASLDLPGDHPDRIIPSSSSFTTTSSTTTSSDPKPETSSTTNTDTNTTETTEPRGPKTTSFQIYPMVMSIGYNPFYNNSVRSAEVHVLHSFAADFYGSPMRLLIMGYVRDERDYDGLDALITDIKIDCDVARQSLARPGWTPSQGVVVVAGKNTNKIGEGGLFDGGWLVR